MSSIEALLDAKIGLLRDNLKTKLSDDRSSIKNPDVLSRLDNLLAREETNYQAKNKLYLLVKNSIELLEDSTILEFYDVIDQIYGLPGYESGISYLEMLDEIIEDDDELIFNAKLVLGCKSNENFYHIYSFFVNLSTYQRDMKTISHFYELRDDIFNLMKQGRDEPYFSKLLKLFHLNSLDENFSNLLDLTSSLKKNPDDVEKVVNFLTDHSKISVSHQNYNLLVGSFLNYKDHEKIDVDLFKNYFGIFYDSMADDGIFNDVPVSYVKDLFRAYDLCCSYTFPNTYLTPIQRTRFNEVFVKHTREAYSDFDTVNEKVDALNQWSLNLTFMVRNKPEVFFDYFDDLSLAVGGNQ